MTSDTYPVVSIIVPARNEAANLAACLESLVAQTGIGFEIIVVDDDSTDRTAEIARSFSGVKLIPAGPLPANWTGKNNAMSAGAKAANPKAKWLLFTDADTVHEPGSLARAVAEAGEHGAALLSYSPAQEVHGFWEKAVMPVIFAELATTYPPQAVNDPTSPIAAANGQYLMISHEAYDAVGGHTTISSDLLEDVALARLVKRSGRKIFFRYGGDAVRTRMYRSFAQLREGWTKNLALLFPRPRALALLRMAEFLLIVGNLSAAIWAKFSGRPNLALQTALLTIILSGWFAMRIRKAHFSAGASVLAVLGLPMFSSLLLRSAKLDRRGGVIWKGRVYQPRASEVGSDENARGRKSMDRKLKGRVVPLLLFLVICCRAAVSAQSAPQFDIRTLASSMEKQLAACPRREIVAQFDRKRHMQVWQKQAWGPPTDVFVDAKPNDDGSVLYPYVLTVEFSLRAIFGPERQSKGDAQKDVDLSPLEGVPADLLTGRYRNTYLAGKDGIRLSKTEFLSIGNRPREWKERSRWPDACWDQLVAPETPK